MIKIITIYDNYKTNGDLKIGWGFSCLVKINNKNILFDTGENSESLLYNLEKLGIKIKDIDILMISHDHWDHTGGLSAVKKLSPNIKLYKPESFSEPTKIMENIYSTGALGAGIIEQSLILKTEKGLIIITGCAHPGIINIIKKSKEFLKENIYLVLGGFHLLDLNDNEILDIINEFKQLGIKKVAPSHCTGDRAIELFKEEYKDNFIENGAGNIIEIK